MTMSVDRSDREQAKFRETISGDTAIAVVSESSNFSPTSNTDAITYEEPSNSIEVYKYRSGGVGGTVLKTVTITYTSSTKKTLQSVVSS